jgi:uncharacterized membrane protein YvbJ
MICPNCEKEIANNIAQCPHCGCHFAVKTASKPVPIPQGVPQNEKGTVAEKSCPHCGSTIAEKAVFCSRCGLSVVQRQDATIGGTMPKPQEISRSENEIIPTIATAPETKFCKHCGKTITATAAFCKWCGYTM